MTTRIFLICLFTVFYSSQASADWVVVGVAYQCNKESNTFSLQGTMDTSSPEDPGTIPPLSGFTVLSKSSNTISCSIGKVHVVAKIDVVEPQDRGMCMGIGFVSLQFLTINGQKVFQNPVMFNSGCFNDPVLFDLKITSKGDIPIMTACRGKWDWGVGYKDHECEETPVTTVPTPSFDCGKSISTVEKLICSDGESSKLDIELNDAYKSALQNNKQADSIRRSQKQWIKERNNCQESGCVRRVYEERLRLLRTMVPVPETPNGAGANNASQSH